MKTDSEKDKRTYRLDTPSGVKLFFASFRHELLEIIRVIRG